MTTITDPGSDLVQAIFLKMHLGLLAKGMKNSRLTGTQILKAATAVTGRSYKRGQYQAAYDDLNAKLKELSNG